MAEGDGVELAFRFDLQYGEVGFRIAADDAGGQFAAVVEGDFDLVGGFNHVVVGEDVAFGRHDHAGTQAGCALLGTVVEPVAKEVAEQRVVSKGAALALDFLAGENMHHRGQGGPGGIGIRGGNLAGWRGGGSGGLLYGDGGQHWALPNPFGFEGAEYEQDGHRNGDRLRKNHPQAMHRKICHRGRICAPANKC